MQFVLPSQSQARALAGMAIQTMPLDVFSSVTVHEVGLESMLSFADLSTNDVFHAYLYLSLGREDRQLFGMRVDDETLTYGISEPVHAEDAHASPDDPASDKVFHFGAITKKRPLIPRNEAYEYGDYKHHCRKAELRIRRLVDEPVRVTVKCNIWKPTRACYSR